MVKNLDNLGSNLLCQKATHKQNTHLSTVLIFCRRQCSHQCSHCIPFSCSCSSRWKHGSHPAWTPAHESRHNSPFPRAARGPSLHFPDNLGSHVFWCLSKQSNTSSLCYIRAGDLNRRSSLQGVELNTRDFRKNNRKYGCIPTYSSWRFIVKRDRCGL